MVAMHVDSGDKTMLVSAPGGRRLWRAVTFVQLPKLPHQSHSGPWHCYLAGLTGLARLLLWLCRTQGCGTRMPKGRNIC